MTRIATAPQDVAVTETQATAAPRVRQKTEEVNTGEVDLATATRSRRLSIRMVTCQCEEEMWCVASASVRQCAEPASFVWSDREIVPEVSAQRLPNPGTAEDFAKQAGSFIGSRPGLGGNVNPLRTNLITVRLWLLVTVAVAIAGGIAAPILDHYLDWQNSAVRALLVGLAGVVVAGWWGLWKLAVRSLADLRFYWRLLTKPSELADLVTTPGELAAAALGYLLGEIAVRLGPGASIVILHTDHLSSLAPESSVPLALARAAQRWRLPLAIEGAFLGTPAAPLWQRLSSVAPESVPFQDWSREPIGKVCELSFVASRLRIDDAQAADYLYLVRSETGDDRPSLHDVLDFVGRELARKGSRDLPDWRQQVVARWKDYRHASLLAKTVQTAATQYQSFTRGFVWLLAVFPGRSFAPGALLRSWPKDEARIPSEKALGRILGCLHDEGIVRLSGDGVEIAPELDPAAAQRMSLGEPDAMGTDLSSGLRAAYWHVLAGQLAAHVGSQTSGGKTLDHALKYVVVMARLSDDEQLPDRVTLRAVLGALQARAANAESDGPLRDAIPWHERIATLAAHNDLDPTVAAQAAARANHLSVWTAENGDLRPAKGDGILWQLWRAYWVGDHALLDQAVAQEEPGWQRTDEARRVLRLGQRFELAGGWALEPDGLLPLDFDVRSARKELGQLLLQSDQPRPLRLFCHRLRVAIGRFDPALSPEERVGDLVDWQRCLDGWAAAEARPHTMGWRLASRARLEHLKDIVRWDARAENRREAREPSQPTFKLLHDAESILVDSLGLTWAAHELGIDRCMAHAAQRRSGFHVAPDVAALARLETALARAKRLQATTGRLTMYLELIYLNSLYNVRRAIDLVEEALDFTRSCGYARSVTEMLKHLRAPLVFNAEGVLDHRKRYLDYEDEAVQWLEDQLARGVGHGHEIRAHLVHSYASMGASIAQTGHHPPSGLTAAACFVRADHHLVGIVLDDHHRLWLQVVRLFHELPLYKQDEPRMALCQTIIELCANRPGPSQWNVDFYLAQTLLVLSNALGRQLEAATRAEAPSKPLRDALDTTVDDMVVVYHKARVVSTLAGAWKYVQARLAVALATYRPGQQLSWPEGGLSQAARMAFVDLAFADQRAEYLFDAFRLYCEMAEFGLAVIVARELDAVYELFPQLRRAKPAVSPEEVCRQMLQLGVEPDPEHLFHASHVLYFRVKGEPFFDNYREQQYSEAMYHLECGQVVEAQARFKKIIDDCESREGTQLLDHDKEAFRRRIDYLQHELERPSEEDRREADRLEQVRRKLIAHGACESFLMTAADLIKDLQREAALTYLAWVRVRGTDSQRARARAMADGEQA